MERDITEFRVKIIWGKDLVFCYKKHNSFGLDHCKIDPCQRRVAKGEIRRDLNIEVKS